MSTAVWYVSVHSSSSGGRYHSVTTLDIRINSCPHHECCFVKIVRVASVVRATTRVVRVLGLFVEVVCGYLPILATRITFNG